MTDTQQSLNTADIIQNGNTTPGHSARTAIQVPIDPLNITSKRGSRRRTGSSRYPDLTPAAPLINHVLEKNPTLTNTNQAIASLKANRQSHSNKRHSYKRTDDNTDILAESELPSLLRAQTSKSEQQYPSLMNAIITHRVNSLHNISTQSSHIQRQNAFDKWLARHPRVEYVYTKITDFGPLNLFLLLIPVALALRYTNQHPAAQFITACLAIMPLAGWMGDATEAISDNLGPSAGGIMNATFGNAAELIVALFAVFRNEDVLVRASLVGSILSNVLLVLGCAILAGGVKYKIQTFNKNGTSVGSTMLMVAILSILIPAMYHALISSVVPDFATTTSTDLVSLQTVQASILAFEAANTITAANPTAPCPSITDHMTGVTEWTEQDQQCWTVINTSLEQHLSLGISCILIITYVLTLFFQLHTHSFFYDEIDAAQQAELTAAMIRTANTEQAKLVSNNDTKSDDALKNEMELTSNINDKGEPIVHRTSSLKSTRSNSIHPLPVSNNSNSTNGEVLQSNESPVVAIDIANPPTQRMSSLKADEHSVVPAQSEMEEEEEEEMSVRKAVFILCIATALVGLLSDVLTSAVQEAGAQLGLTETFMGIIIVAIVGNAAEHWSAVTCAMNNKLDISLSIAFGSALQVAMFVLPVVILCSYARASPMVLVLPLMESFALVGSVILAWMVVQSGGTNWLEGLMLLMIYLMLALAFFYQPAQSEPLT